MRKQSLLAAGLVASVGVLFGVSSVVSAATSADSDLNQTVNAGAISTSILDSGGSPVGSPTFAMSATTASTTTQTSTGTFGDNNQRITVENPGAANNGWTLALSGTGSWSNVGASVTYPFDAATSAAGQLTVNPAVGAVFSTFGTTTGITLGTSDNFDDVTSSINLLSAAAGSDDVWSGYVTGIGLSQTVPAGTPAESFSLTVTQTVTAI